MSLPESLIVHVYQGVINIKNLSYLLMDVLYDKYHCNKFILLFTF